MYAADSLRRQIDAGGTAEVSTTISTHQRTETDRVSFEFLAPAFSREHTVEVRSSSTTASA